jgi:hypothetical protein
VDTNLSEQARVIQLSTVDIGGTDTATMDPAGWGAWHDVADFERIYAKVRLGTWNAADDLDTCKLEQATSAAGAGAKDLTTSGAGLDYDTNNPVDATGDTVVLEANADQLDVDNGYRFVRVLCAETGNTGQDDVEGVLILHSARQQFAEREGAAVAGSRVYVRPS